MESQIIIIFAKTESNFLVCGQDSFEIESQKQNCMYFPQFQQIFYYQLSKNQTQSQSLEAIAKDIITANIDIFQGLVEPDHHPLIFKSFDQNQQTIASDAKANFQLCNRVKVFFQQRVYPAIKENKTTLTLKIELKKTQLIKYDVYKKFQVRDILVIEKLAKYRFTALKIGHHILKYYESLDKISLTPGNYQISPLFSFQFFYHEMREVYKKLKDQGFKFEQTLDSFGLNEEEMKFILNIFERLRSNNIDRLTHFTILYLTSRFFQPTDFKRYLLGYFHGKIGALQTHKETQLVSLMLHCLQQLQNSQIDTIYIAHSIDEANFNEAFSEGQIVRIETFCPASDSLRKLNLSPDQSYHIYEIKQLTAKSVGIYNGELHGYNFITLPYNQYLIDSIKRDGRNNVIKLIQLSIPKNLETDLIFWIGDRLQDARRLQEKVDKELKTINYEVIIIKDNVTLQSWLKKYYCLTSSRKICIIFNGENLENGLTAIQLIRRFLGPQPKMLIYSENAQQFTCELREGRNYDVRVRVGREYLAVLAFIVNCLNCPDLSESECEPCSCSIF